MKTVACTLMDVPNDDWLNGLEKQVLDEIRFQEAQCMSSDWEEDTAHRERIIKHHQSQWHELRSWCNKKSKGEMCPPISVHFEFCAP
jgi:hypothetical protein